MGIFEFIGVVFNSAAKPVIRAGNAADESLEMATTFIHNRSVEQRVTDREIVRVRTAETLDELQNKLNANEQLKAIYEQLDAEFK